MLEARGLCKTYRVGRRSLPVVQGVDLTVEPGSFVTILGRSGSGKSTLLALLGGLARPSAGRVELLGQDLSRCSAARRGAQVGTMFQQTGLLPTLTALENALLHWFYPRVDNAITPSGEPRGGPLDKRRM